MAREIQSIKVLKTKYRTIVYVNFSDGKSGERIFENGQWKTHRMTGEELAAAKQLAVKNGKWTNWRARRETAFAGSAAAQKQEPAQPQAIIPETGTGQKIEYWKLSRQEQNRILRRYGYRWLKYDEEDYDVFNRSGWYLFSHDGRQVTVDRAFAEIERGVDAVARDIAAEIERERRHRELRREIDSSKSEIAAHIRRHGTMPTGMNTPSGDVVLDTQDVYGGGDWFVVGAGRIWYVQNNGGDGDNWSRNNVRTGGAGATGWYIAFNTETARRLRELDAKFQALRRGELPD